MNWYTQMPQRQKLLLGVVAVMFVGYLGDMAYRRLYAEPLREAATQTETLRGDLHDTRLAVRREQNRLEQVPQLGQRSLPRNLEIAISVYRGWLLQLIQEVGLEGTNVNSGQPTLVNNEFHRIDFSILGSGTLQQATEFLHRFYRAPYLHKIRSLSMTPLADGNVDLVLSIEALSLISAEQDDLLPIADTPDANRLSDEDRQILRRNLFARGDPLDARVALTAITSDATGRFQAWLSVKPNGRTHLLASGESIELDNVEIQVHAVKPDQIDVSSNGERRRVVIGQTLAEAGIAAD